MRAQVLPVHALRNSLHGHVHMADDVDYPIARRGLGMTPVTGKSPALVVEPHGCDDVAEAVRFAREHGLDLSVRAGGHDVLGASTTPDGMLLDLHRLNGINLDPASGLVQVGAGVRAGQLTAAGEPHGLVPMVGMNSDVGVGGLTLGGGMGWLAGRFGATVDHLLAVDLVTADGQAVRADAEQNADLFWALRGGGGNFGVVTSFTYRMQEVGPVLAGDLGYRTDPAEMLRFIRSFLEVSPDELEIGVLFTLDPEPVAVVRLCWSGDPEAGQEALRPLRAYAPTVLDTVEVQSYAGFANGGARFDSMACRGGEFDGLNDRAIDALTAVINRGGPKGCLVGILHFVHGALCRPEIDTPFIRTPGNILYNIIASWQGTEDDPERVAWADAASEALRPVNSERIYVNYLSYPEQRYVEGSFGRHYERLRAVKRHYDPTNVFHNNRNIPV